MTDESVSVQAPIVSETGRSLRDEGPVEILCKEIGFAYDDSLERDDVFVAFVRVLVGEVSDMISWRSAISRGFSEAGYDTLESMKPLKSVQALLDGGIADREKRCAELHNGPLDQPDDGPCNHFIDMLSSCVSAVRFGLENPCRSRHAAAAADHIWKHRYGLRLFDRLTSDWQHDWARRKLQQAIISLIPPPRNEAPGQG